MQQVTISHGAQSPPHVVTVVWPLILWNSLMQSHSLEATKLENPCTYSSWKDILSTAAPAKSFLNWWWVGCRVKLNQKQMNISCWLRLLKEHFSLFFCGGVSFAFFFKIEDWFHTLLRFLMILVDYHYKEGIICYPSLERTLRLGWYLSFRGQGREVDFARKRNLDSALCQHRNTQEEEEEEVVLSCLHCNPDRRLVGCTCGTTAVPLSTRARFSF